MSAVEALCAKWDGFTKGESATTEQVREAYAADLARIRAAVMQGGQTPSIRCNAVIRVLEEYGHA